jgi:hypothetical protein
MSGLRNKMVGWQEGSKSPQKGCIPVIMAFVVVILLVLPVAATQKHGEFTPTQVEALSGKAIGESSGDPYAVACVMRNRLVGGWAPHKVGGAFFAPWRPPTKEQAEKLGRILRGQAEEGECNTEAWYQFSEADVLTMYNIEGCFLFASGGNRYYSKYCPLR